MRYITLILKTLSSRQLTIWMAGGFAIYYLTTAIWVGEAFGRFILLLKSNNLVRALFFVFFLNILFRTTISAWGMRRNYIRLILGLPMRLGFVIFILSLFLSVNIQQSMWLLLGEGDVVNPPWEKTPFKVVKIKSALKEDVLMSEDSPVFEYEPSVTLINGSGQIYRIGAFPARKVRRTYIHILNFGIAPRLELRKGEKAIASGAVALRLIPFGRVDSFELRKLKLYMYIIPNTIVLKGDEITRQYNIENPRYHVQILKGDKIIFEGEANDNIQFDDMSLNFYKPLPWVQLELVRNPVYPVFIGSLFLMFFGVILYPFSLFLK